MSTTQQILSQEFDKLRIDLISKHKQLGMKASGKWENELEVLTSTNNAKIVGEGYTNQLVNGRKPGKFPPVDAIKQWIVDKGIVNNIKGNISVSSLAFLIARKIAKSGTKYFKQGGTDLIDGVVTNARIQSIIDKVGAELTFTLVTKLENEFKKIAV